MRSPFDTFGVNTWSGGGDGGSTLNALRALARTLAGVQANATNVATAVSVIETKRLSVWAVPVPSKMSETMTGVQNSPLAGQFRYRASGPLGTRDLGTLTGASAASGLPWTGMAFWDGTAFRGIVVWSWTGDTIDSSGEVINPAARPVTTPAMMFHPQLGDGLFRRIKTIIIEADGTLTLNATDTTTGFQFSSAQDPTANGYYSTSFFSRDDGVWGIQPNARLDGDTPGPALTTGGYGISAYQSSEPVNSYYWGGTAQASSNYVGVVFSA
jgi:hypothetical protein